MRKEAIKKMGIYITRSKDILKEIGDGEGM